MNVYLWKYVHRFGIKQLPHSHEKSGAETIASAPLCVVRSKPVSMSRRLQTGVHLTHLIERHANGDGSRQYVGNRHAPPHSPQVEEERQQHQSRQQEEQLTGKRQEDGDSCLAYRLEELTDDNLRTHNRESEHADLQGMNGTLREDGISRKGSDKHLREEYAEDKAGGRNDTAGNDSHPQGAEHTGYLPCAIVVAGNRLHTLRDTHDNHDKHHLNAVDDTEGSDGVIVAVGLQLMVDENDDAAGAHVHREGRHTDAENILDDAFLQLHALALETHIGVLIEEVRHNPDERDGLRNDGCRRRTPDAPSENENEHRRDDNVARHGNKRGKHRLLRVARGTHDIVETHHQVRDRRAEQDNLHEVAGIGQRSIAGAEEAQDVVKEKQRDASVEHGVDNTQHEHVAGNVLGSVLVFLSQTDGGNRRSTHADQRTESYQEVHQREGDGKAGNGHRAYTVADKHTVNDIVERGDGHRNDGRKRVLHQKFSDGRFAQNMRTVVHNAISCCQLAIFYILNQFTTRGGTTQRLSRNNAQEKSHRPDRTPAERR